LWIRTHSPIDGLLGGGIPTGVITHVYGEAASGKTTLAMQAAGNLSAEGYQTLYLDCDGRFSFERFSQLFQDEDLLERLTLIVPRSLDEQTEMVSILEAYVSGRTRLVVVDTIASNYRSELSPETHFSRYREVVEKQLPEMLGLCRRRRNLAVLLLNQVVSRIGDGEGNTVPSMGDGISKFCQVTLRLSGTRLRSVGVAEIVEHFLDLKGRVFYRITGRGLCEVESETVSLLECGEDASQVSFLR